MNLPHSYVLTDLADEEDPTRGDCNAYRNLGRLFAQKTGKEFICVEDNESCRRLLNERGIPDAVFSFKNRPDYKDIYHVYELNENLSYYARNNYNEELVSHHLDVNLIEEEAHAFQSRHPDLKKRLVAVMNIDGKEDSQILLASKISDMIAASDECETTIFICGTWRTRQEDQQRLIRYLREAAEEKGLSDAVDIKSYSMSKDFNERASQYNPYPGLIGTASDFVIVGHSMSIVSECLMSGKTLMLVGNTNHDTLIERGICHRLSGLDARLGFPTCDIEPVNITEGVVDGLVRHFYAFEKSKAAKAAPSCQPT